jgi:hypothetical protein
MNEYSDKLGNELVEVDREKYLPISSAVRRIAEARNITADKVWDLVKKTGKLLDFSASGGLATLFRETGA